jgi:ATP-dependent RNA helicase SUPV3L1/SUV3
VLSGGEAFKPRVRLLGELGHDSARQRAQQRLEAFIAGEAGRRLTGLRRLEAAVADGQVKGLARGLAFRLVEAGGVLDRTGVRAEVRALSPVERRVLRGLGVRLGAFSIYLPGLLKPEARVLNEALARREVQGWRPPIDQVSRLPVPCPSPKALAAFGLRAIRGLAVPVEQLEALDETLRAAPKQGGGMALSEAAREALGWSADEARTILKGLGFATVRKPGEGPTIWRRRFEKEFTVEHKAAAAPHSPFAALAALRGEPAPARRPRRRRKANGV